MRHLRSGLIAFEIAGALVLLVGCGLMIRSLVNMMATDFGFDADGLARSRIMLRARNYPDAAAYRLLPRTIRRPGRRVRVDGCFQQLAAVLSAAHVISSRRTKATPGRTPGPFS